MTDDEGKLVSFLQKKMKISLMQMKITLAILILMVMLAHQEEDLEKQMEIIPLINI